MHLVPEAAKLLSTVTVLRWGLSGATARTTTSDSAGVLARPLPRVNGRLSAAQIADEREARTLMIEFEVKRTWGVLSLWRARRGRRAATTAISPLMNKTRQRLDGLPDSVWREPYVVGFLGMLITLHATRNAGSLGTAALASAQAGAWSDITGMAASLVGEEICFLTAAGDKAFDLGCRNATSFFEAVDLLDRRSEESLLKDRISPVDCGDAEEDRSALWARYFDAYVGHGASGSEP